MWRCGGDRLGNRTKVNFTSRFRIFYADDTNFLLVIEFG